MAHPETVKFHEDVCTYECAPIFLVHIYIFFCVENDEFETLMVTRLATNIYLRISLKIGFLDIYPRLFLLCFPSQNICIVERFCKAYCGFQNFGLNLADFG